MRSPKYVKLGSLNEPKVVSIVLFLSNNPGSTGLDLKAISFTDTRINRILENMTTEGLLCTSDEGEIRSKTTFQLTAKGYRVTAKLKEIDGIMQEITQEGLLGRASHQPRDDPSHPQAYILRNSLDLTSSRARQIRTGEDANDFMI